MITAACSAAVGTPLASRMSPTSARERRCGDSSGLPGDDAAQVDDAPHSRGLRGRGEGPRRGAVAAFERRVRAEGVDQVVGDVHALQGALHRIGVHHVGDRDLDVVRPRAVAELSRIAGHAPDRVSRAQQFRDTAADVPRRTGNQAAQW